MFKNFGTVFKFTLKNQAMTKSYIVMTVIVAMLGLLLPGVIMLIAGHVSTRDEADTDQQFTIDSVIVVDEYAEGIDFNILNSLSHDDAFGKLKYSTKSSVDEALQASHEALAGGKKPIILVISKDDRDYGDSVQGGLYTNLIIPTGSEVSKDEASLYNGFIQDNEQLFTLVASGMKVTDMAKLNEQVVANVYTPEGYESGTDVFRDSEANDAKVADSVLKIFKMIVTYIVVMVMYFLIIMYGSGVTQSVVLEKQNKLMDTMLVSVRPEAMIMGKLLAVALAGITQVLLWGASAIGGLFLGNAVAGAIYPESKMDFSVFLNSIGSLGVFKPVNVVIAVFVVISGFLFYLGLAGIAGSISNNQEESSANSYIFVLVLLVSFFMAMYGGVLEGATGTEWMNFIPSVAVLILPGGIAVGSVSTIYGVIALFLLLIVTAGVVYVAGRLYKMMSLYKGDSVKLGKALKMLITNK